MTRDELFAFVKEAYETSPDYPWSRYPEYAVLRHKNTGKWYGLVMSVPAEKLALQESGNVEILNVKTDPDDAILLKLADEIIPAYHMNKKHWISIRLDSKLARELIQELVSTSYELTK